MIQVMKVVAITAAFCLSADASFAGQYKSGPMSAGLGIVPKESLANREQALELQKLVIEEIRAERENPESIRIINEKLIEMNLPTIQASPRVEIIGGNGFVPTLEGATIEDGGNIFCLPCKVGFNKYELGVLPASSARQ